MRRLAVLIVVLSAFSAIAADGDGRPSVVFLLLDTTRADRMSAWGNPRATTPHLDGLAAAGIRFARHFANSHATRPSMPQLMTGRYYQQSILREFRSDSHPREYPFAVPDPSEVILPHLLRAAGYQTVSVSAHPWVSPDSRFGEPFDHFELLESPLERGHADAEAIVDRALALWGDRDSSRPTFMYLHFMDPHIPRSLPGGRLRFTTGVQESVASRFDEAGEPTFGSKRRGWDRSDARDFSAADADYFVAVYDTLLAYMDEQIGRLLARLEAKDPGLTRTLVVVVADHGEELGEYGRTSHEDWLADGVQHIPWILAGGGLSSGQVVDQVTENVDVVPTLATVLALPLPESARFDGQAQVGADGRVCGDCRRSTATFAWEEYRALRGGRALLREPPPHSMMAHCRGPRRLLGPDRSHPRVDEDKRRRMAWHLEKKLGTLERSYRASRYAASASRAFQVPAIFWRVPSAEGTTCAEVGIDTSRSTFDAAGWLWTGRGMVIVRDPADAPLVVEIDAPDGTYDVAAGVAPIASPPWYFGFDRWLRKSFRDTAPTAYVPLGRATARAGHLRILLPPDAARNQHVLAIRLTPPGAGEGQKPARDPVLEERLRRLGYVE